MTFSRSKYQQVLVKQPKKQTYKQTKQPKNKNSKNVSTGSFAHTLANSINCTEYS